MSAEWYPSGGMNGKPIIRIPKPNVAQTLLSARCPARPRAQQEPDVAHYYTPARPKPYVAQTLLSARSSLETQRRQECLRHVYRRNSGGSPFIILPNFLAPKPFEKVFIIFFI